MDKTKKPSITYEVDIVCLTQVNKDWRAVQQDNTIWNRTIGWRNEQRVQVSYHATRPFTSESKVGRTAMVAFDDLVFSISVQDSDSRGLVRWSFISITGKNKVVTTSITCYFLVKGSSPGSIYSQHLTYIADNRESILGDLVCPRQLFGYDLKCLIEDEMLERHQIVVCGDFNSSY